ncbi:methyltransferase [Streptomyces sp. SID13666]|uniref:methyltransferase n=1 Tax=unclassified Streptomyces TaxID=2593676 RepID=UPI0013C156B1|nr:MULTISPECIES: methyltransferase [unclassified Streptomyces]NEA58547.1 methyltransferase [Streptomyces sp. SID13666]NEA74703.1 methyltransferase [Streptomyces sp. SID13588]
MSGNDRTNGPVDEESTSDQERAAASRKLLGALTGSWVAQACYTAAVLGISDVLAEGPKAAAEIAAECNAHPDGVHRILRALASVGIFEQDEQDRFSLTPVSALLRSDVPNSMRNSAIMLGEEVFRSFGALVHAVRTGTPAFDEVHGMPMYTYLQEHKEVARTFNAALGSRGAVPAAFAQCSLDGVRTVVDIGGGNGNLLAEVLTDRPELHGVLLELPEAVNQARQRLEAAGLTDRTTLVEGSFFEEVPTGGDLYLLSRCLHNWTDEKALAILRTTRAALPAGGRLVILEKIIPSGPGPSQAKVYDLLMLAMVEGRNRTGPEYRALAEKAGFEVTAVRPAPATDPNGEGAIEVIAV